MWDTCYGAVCLCRNLCYLSKSVWSCKIWGIIGNFNASQMKQLHMEQSYVIVTVSQTTTTRLYGERGSTRQRWFARMVAWRSEHETAMFKAEGFVHKIIRTVVWMAFGGVVLKQNGMDATIRECLLPLEILIGLILIIYCKHEVAGASWKWCLLQKPCCCGSGCSLVGQQPAMQHRLVLSMLLVLFPFAVSCPNALKQVQGYRAKWRQWQT